MCLNKDLPDKHRIRRWILLLFGLFVSSGVVDVLHAQEAPGYHFGVFPHMSTVRMEQKYAPVATAFGQLLGKPVQFGTASDFDKFRTRLKKGEFDIALISPFDIVPVVDEGGYIPLARAPSRPASIVVINDSPLQQLADLRDKTLGLPAGTPVNVILQITLDEQGLVKDQGIHYRDYATVPACLHQLLLKTVDACGSASGIGLVIFQNKMGVKLRELMTTQPFPHMVYVAHPRLQPSEREMLTRAILGLDNTEKVSGLMQAIGHDVHYIPYRDADYDIIRRYRQRWIKDVQHTP